MLKLIQIVMLPAQDESQIVANLDTAKLTFGKKITSEFLKFNEQGVHLYFLSPDKIGVADKGHWCIKVEPDGIIADEPEIITASIIASMEFHQGYKKIIATSDKNLRIVVNSNAYSSREEYEELPTPTDEFLEHFCEVGRIDEVNVEYDLDEELGVLQGKYGILKYPTAFLPVITNSNNIIVVPFVNTKPVKESWNKEEVIELMKAAWNAQMTFSANKDRIHFREWLEQNSNTITIKLN